MVRSSLNLSIKNVSRFIKNVFILISETAEILRKAATDGVQVSITDHSEKWVFPFTFKLKTNSSLGILLDFDCEKSKSLLKNVRNTQLFVLEVWAFIIFII